MSSGLGSLEASPFLNRSTAISYQITFFAHSGGSLKGVCSAFCAWVNRGAMHIRAKSSFFMVKKVCVQFEPVMMPCPHETGNRRNTDITFFDTKNVDRQLSMV